jgi:hypothetical protein
MQSTATPRPGERIEQLDAQIVNELKNALREAVDAFKSRPDPPAKPASVSEATPIDETLCFIVMPFRVESLAIVYEDFVKPALTDRCWLRPERGDDVFGSNVVMDDITKMIRRARLIVADLTGRKSQRVLRSRHRTRARQAGSAHDAINR